MDNDIQELRQIISVLTTQYQNERRDQDGRLREPRETQQLRDKIEAHTAELKFLESTSEVLSQRSGTERIQSRSCRLPAGMAKFKRPTAEVHFNVQDYIWAFERKLRADSYPQDKYVFALSACCEPEEADWVDANLLPS